MEVALGSDAGIWQRQKNDAHLSEALASNVTLLAVADGFGVVGKGIPTAAMALGTLRDYLRHRKRSGAFRPHAMTQNRVRALLLAALDHVNARLFAQSGSNEDFVGSGASLTAVLVVGLQAFVAHVGDARAYLSRLGRLESLTSDDEMFSDELTSGAKTTAPAKPRTQGLLWRSLGTQGKLEASIANIEILSGDQLVLCTDGVHRRLSTEEIGDALERSTTANEAVTLILARAKMRDDAEDGAVVVARELLAPTPGADFGQSPFENLRSTVVLLILGIAALSIVIYAYHFGLVPR